MPGSPPRACVIGSPIAHSRSPMIHGHWLKTYGISGSYDKIEVTPDTLDDFLKRIRNGEFAGCNATIPLKELVFEKADWTDPATRRLKSANTVFMDGGKLCAISTDGLGFMASLQHSAPHWSSADAVAVILGAGGAARSIIDALIHDGVTMVYIVNRTIARAKTIVADYPDHACAVVWSELTTVLPAADLLINSTSLGMAGQPPLDIDLSGLKPTAIITDIVYTPLETDLLRQAAARGNPCVDGLGMLLHQAVPGFEKWFGVWPEVTAELRNLVVADILGQDS